MLEQIFNELFGTYDEFTKAAKELLEKYSEENEKKEEETNRSYFHKVYDEYKDGEHVAHEEKEVKDGKVLKDEVFTKELSDKTDEEPKKVECKKNEDNLTKLQNELNEYKDYVYKHTKKEIFLKDENEKLKAEVNELTAKNQYLEEKLKTIKDLFC